MLHKAGCLKENPKLKWDEYLAIHEVYYDKKGNPESVTRQMISIMGEEGKDSLKSIKWTLKEMTKALKKPILDYDTLISIDANVSKLSDNFLGEWIHSIGDKSILLDDMYYGLSAYNTLSSEFARSKQLRWEKSWNNMKESKKRYENEGFNLDNIKVCSAKYVIINMKNKIKNSHIWEFI